MVWSKADEMVKKNTGGHYPSPPTIVECVKYGYSASFIEGCFGKHEAEKFSEMVTTPESAALIGLLDGTTLLKKNLSVKPEGSVTTIAVLGAGLMGAGISQVSAEKGYKVLMKDRDVARSVTLISSFPADFLYSLNTFHSMYCAEQSVPSAIQF